MDFSWIFIYAANNVSLWNNTNFFSLKNIGFQLLFFIASFYDFSDQMLHSKSSYDSVIFVFSGEKQDSEFLEVP